MQIVPDHIRDANTGRYFFPRGSWRMRYVGPDCSSGREGLVKKKHIQNH